MVHSYLSTSMTRGYYAGGAQPDIELTRYLVFNDAPMPKRAKRTVRPVPLARGIEVYPQPARDELRFIVDDARDAVVTLHDLLGRKLREVAVSGGGRAHGRMSLDGIQPGMYMLLLRTTDAVRAGKVMVTE